MGMYDTIHLPEPIDCAACEAHITSTQTKAFDSTLEDYWIGDCVGHAEEIRIAREKGRAAGASDKEVAETVAAIQEKYSEKTRSGAGAGSTRSRPSGRPPPRCAPGCRR